MTYKNRAAEDPVGSYHHGTEALTFTGKEKTAKVIGVLDLFHSFLHLWLR
jgi:hypothetical protein